MSNTNNKYAKFYFNRFPYIYVEFGENIENDEQYNEFEKDWLKCLEYDKDFMFIFDTQKMGMISVSYIYKLINFLDSIKKHNNIKFLKYSIIVVNSWYIQKMLNLIFSMHAPISTVYIVENKDNYDIGNLIKNIEKKTKIEDNNVSMIKV